MRKLTSYNEDNFRQIEQYEGISVVRFSAPWCPPCRASEDMFSQFAKRLDGDIQIGKVNVDQAPVLTTKYEIWGLPSVLIFNEGQLVKRIPGVKPSAVYAQAIADIKKGQ
ncbi:MULTISPECIES: thioredoxin family protein [Pectobacterium]|uniref:Thioredoxin n=4 Tax=Pectobacterium TaxID=122277 RepID=A0A855MG78_9GAMM|nr:MULTISPECIES: thioredoxin family protein [Pectobacterium]AVT57618.1 Thioredoxin [Pectobacterium versatile]KHT16845.1 thioredoxin [Pectobacterium carotovorum subsp. carotovorum]MBA0184665.1 thioredoxin family protein [Pectobacterium versatile]MBE5221387.1 thioredoxin family protein [Pectobacterium quasiaquaticum]MBQ4780984.1 thioredoxin fold domain-containing protein [Pectobacterium versatile]